MQKFEPLVKQHWSLGPFRCFPMYRMYGKYNKHFNLTQNYPKSHASQMEASAVPQPNPGSQAFDAFAFPEEGQYDNLSLSGDGEFDLLAHRGWRIWTLASFPYYNCPIDWSGLIEQMEEAMKRFEDFKQRKSIKQTCIWMASCSCCCPLQQIQ